MKTYRTRFQLKSEVKSLLKGNWSKGVLLFLIPSIVFWFTNEYSNFNEKIKINYDTATVNFDQLVRMTANSGIISLIVSLIFLVITLSATFRGLDWLEDPELDFAPIKSNFTYFRSPDWWKLCLIYIISYIFLTLWTVLLIIPGIIKYMAYSQTYFIYKDLNDRGLANNYKLTDYITKSRQLMVGNKWRYFVLQLSFIGWWLLGFLTLGVGFIWIYPYYKLTMANFYKDLKENNCAILE